MESDVLKYECVPFGNPECVQWSQFLKKTVGKNSRKRTVTKMCNKMMTTHDRVMKELHLVDQY